MLSLVYVAGRAARLMNAALGRGLIYFSLVLASSRANSANEGLVEDFVISFWMRSRTLNFSIGSNVSTTFSNCDARLGNILASRQKFGTL